MEALKSRVVVLGPLLSFELISLLLGFQKPMKFEQISQRHVVGANWEGSTVTTTVTRVEFKRTAHHLLPEVPL